MGKSTAVENRLGGRGRLLKGGVTPYQLYCELDEHRDEPVVQDDCDTLLKGNPDGIHLLKQATQTRPVKVIQWNRKTVEIRSEDLPPEFSTTSKMLLVANGWLPGNEDVAAIESRAHLFYFAPSAPEVYRFAARLGIDPEIYEFTGRHIELLAGFDLRVFEKAAEMKLTDKRLGTETWKAHVLKHGLDQQDQSALTLMRNPAFGNNDAPRAREFARLVGRKGAERTFYRRRNWLMGRLGEAMAENRCQDDTAALTNCQRCSWGHTDPAVEDAVKRLNNTIIDYNSAACDVRESTATARALLARARELDIEHEPVLLPEPAGLAEVQVEAGELVALPREEPPTEPDPSYGDEEGGRTSRRR